MGCRRSGWIRVRTAVRAALVALALGASVPGAAAAAEAAEDGTGGSAGPVADGTAKPVSLDALLKLPTATTPVAPAKGPPEKGGATRPEWLERFDAARAELGDAEQRLEAVQAKIAKLSANTSAWQMSAPGGTAGENGPLSFELRKQMREGREEVERAQNSLDELRIEANLAGVPEAWTVSASPTP